MLDEKQVQLRLLKIAKQYEADMEDFVNQLPSVNIKIIKKDQHNVHLLIDYLAFLSNKSAMNKHGLISVNPETLYYLKLANML